MNQEKQREESKRRYLINKIKEEIEKLPMFACVGGDHTHKGYLESDILKVLNKLRGEK